jgi:hypothetical protein
MVACMKQWISGLTSAIVPGTGQLLRGRLGDALLFFGLAIALHTITGGLAFRLGSDLARDGMIFGGFGFPSDRVSPVTVVTTALMVMTHLGAAWDAASDGPTHGAT